MCSCDWSSDVCSSDLEGLSPSFSQNPKQVLVASDFWCVRSKVFRHQHRLLYRRHDFVEAHQLSVPCTFSSAVLAQSQVLSAPFLQRCRPHVGFFGCLSYGHVKVLRNGFLRRNFEAAARLFSAPLLRLFLHSFVFLLFACVVSFNMSLFKLLHCTLYYFFVLIKDEFISF